MWKIFLKSLVQYVIPTIMIGIITWTMTGYFPSLYATADQKLATGNWYVDDNGRIRRHDEASRAAMYAAAAAYSRRCFWIRFGTIAAVASVAIVVLAIVWIRWKFGSVLLSS